MLKLRIKIGNVIKAYVILLCQYGPEISEECFQHPVESMPWTIKRLLKVKQPENRDMHDESQNSSRKSYFSNFQLQQKYHYIHFTVYSSHTKDLCKTDKDIHQT